MGRCFFFLLFLLASACADKTGILVEVTSDDLSVPGDIDTLQFIAVSNAGHRTDRTYRIMTTWPHSLTIVPANGEDTTVTITVIGRHEGAFHVQRAVQVPFERGTTRRVVVTLTRDCVNRMCAEGVDCVGGECVEQPMLDGGVDGGSRDAGPRDAAPGDDSGPRDAGQRDAGPMDAGPRDSGTDSGPIDSGPPGDGGVDGGLLRLFISEYVEGTSNNKYIEIYNPTPVAIPLAGYAIRIYYNGSVSVGRTIMLAGTIPMHGTFVLANTMAALPGATPNQNAGTLDFNGNDAVTLEAPGGARLDVVGVIGSSTAFGQDTTFVRDSGLTIGLSGNAWDPSEWSTLPTDNHELGMHTP